MKKLLIGLLALASITSYAKEFTVTIQEFGGKKTVTTVNLPSEDVVTVDGDKARCLIDATVYNPAEKYSFIALDIEDSKGNRASGGGLVENGSAVMMITMNNHLCLVQEAKN